MSETTIESDEQEWPENCPQCGTELETGFVQLERTSGQQGTEAGTPGPPIAQDFCPNPDCPGKASDLASAGEPAEGARARQPDEPTGPGSMGGDNGGG